MSELPGPDWCTSTAITFAPATSSDGLSGNSKNVASSGRSCAIDAGVHPSIAPAGMLLRTASTPFTYTTAPSSRSNRRRSDPIPPGFDTLNTFRK
jgi:hypothetical protein